LISTFVTPLLQDIGFSVAFGVPAVLICFATLIFYLGKPYYLINPPGDNLITLAFGIVKTSIVEKRKNKYSDLKKSSLLDYAKEKYGEKPVEDVKQVFRVLKVFIAIPILWSLFDQHSSRWVFQAEKLNLEIFSGYTIKVSQIQILNPGLLLMLLPIFNKCIYPLCKKCGIVMTPLFHKMGIGMFIASLSFICSAGLELYIDTQPPLSIPWYYIIPQFALLTAAEVMISVTGLEFAYTQAPTNMKSLVMSSWTLTISLGNALVAVISLINLESMVINFAMYAGLMSIFMLIFLFINRNFVEYTQG